MKKIIALFALLLTSVGFGLAGAQPVSADVITNCFSWIEGSSSGVAKCTIYNSTPEESRFRVRLTCRSNSSVTYRYAYGPWKYATGYSQGYCPYGYHTTGTTAQRYNDGVYY